VIDGVSLVTPDAASAPPLFRYQAFISRENRDAAVVLQRALENFVLPKALQLSASGRARGAASATPALLPKPATGLRPTSAATSARLARVRSNRCAPPPLRRNRAPTPQRRTRVTAPFPLPNQRQSIVRGIPPVESLGACPAAAIAENRRRPIAGLSHLPGGTAKNPSRLSPRK
jgi:hypothetical protein